MKSQQAHVAPTNDGEHAFPYQFSIEPGSNDPFTGETMPPDTERRYMWRGMTLRAYLAGQAMVGLLASDDNEPCISRDPEGIAREIQEHMDNKAKAAVRYADALIVALKANGGAA